MSIFDSKWITITLIVLIIILSTLIVINILISNGDSVIIIEENNNIPLVSNCDSLVEIKTYTQTLSPGVMGQPEDCGESCIVRVQLIEMLENKSNVWGFTEYECIYDELINSNVIDKDLINLEMVN